MERLQKKMETAKKMVPSPEVHSGGNALGMLYYGTSAHACEEARDLLTQAGTEVDAMRIKAFPFDESVRTFIESHDMVFVVEQNRDAQLRTLLINEMDLNPAQLKRVLHYDGTPISADFVLKGILSHLQTKSH
jgi:2-oxoglutarate ferredoxin oxidoreductase subunit alpha